MGSVSAYARSETLHEGERSSEGLSERPIPLLSSQDIARLSDEDVDRVFKRAVDAGATPQQELKDQFYGDRSGTVIDPFGHVWTIATHVEDVSPEEMQRRMEAQATAHAAS